jgi:hypothetical protein
MLAIPGTLEVEVRHLRFETSWGFSLKPKYKTKGLGAVLK